jgi:hypothetical protein
VTFSPGVLGERLEYREPIASLPFPGGSGDPNDDAAERENRYHGGRKKQKHRSADWHIDALLLVSPINETRALAVRLRFLCTGRNEKMQPACLALCPMPRNTT